MRFFIRNRHRVKSFSFSDVREKKGRRTRSPIWPVWTDARAVDGEEANIFSASSAKILSQIIPKNCRK